MIQCFFFYYVLPRTTQNFIQPTIVVKRMLSFACTCICADCKARVLSPLLTNLKLPCKSSVHAQFVRANNSALVILLRRRSRLLKLPLHGNCIFIILPLLSPHSTFDNCNHLLKKLHAHNILAFFSRTTFPLKSQHFICHSFVSLLQAHCRTNPSQLYYLSPPQIARESSSLRIF